jgi:hypothetical protein
MTGINIKIEANRENAFLAIQTAKAVCVALKIEFQAVTIDNSFRLTVSKESHPADIYEIYTLNIKLRDANSKIEELSK